MQSIEEIGASVGRRLAALRDHRAGPRSTAIMLVHAILAEESRAKLPAILADDDVIRLMTEAGVTAAMIRQALTDSRQQAKRASAGKTTDDIKTPRQQRRRPTAPIAAEASNPASAQNDLLAGLVTETPIDAL